MAKLLITGASGLLGANLLLAATEEHEVVAVCHQHPIVLEGVEVVVADLSQPGAAREVIGACRPAWVIHCAAATSVDGCESDPVSAYRLNRDMAGWVAGAARGCGARLVHVSTDAVFDGEHGGYREEDTPRPVHVYGMSKLAGEQAVAAAHPEAAIVRTNLYGWNALPKLSLAEWFLERLEAGERCPGFADVWFTPILVNDLAPLLLKMLEVGLRGVYHVGGGECLSKYEFGVRLAEVFGLDASLIQPVEVGATELQAKRPRRLCLDGSKIERELRVRLPAAIEGLERFRKLCEGACNHALRELLVS
jgi:dTDP-4-dehydrorhamnose reductase